MAQFRTRKAPVDGVLLIDKPVGPTSHDVVARVRRQLRPAVKKVGHAGTLDPFATGLLVVLVGRATKLARFFVDLPKEYVCTVRFGVRSDSGDLTGELTTTGSTTTREAVEAALPRVPRVRAAARAHDVRRQGRRRAPLQEGASRRDRRDADQARWRSPPSRCSPSTRRRSSCAAASRAPRARTCGSSLSTWVRRSGAGAHLTELSRTAVGDLTLEDALGLAAFEEAVEARESGDDCIPALLPSAGALQFMPAVQLSAAQVTAVRNGARLPGGPQEPVRVTYRGELIAIYGPSEEGHALKLLVKL